MKCFFLTLLIAGVACLQTARSQDAPATTEVKPTDIEVSEETKAEIAQLIKHLESGKFADRKKATDRLIAIGAPAVPAVAKSAESEVVEVRGRSMEILKGMYNGSDAAAKKAATDALTKISEGDNELNAVRAKQILIPAIDPNARVNQFGGIVVNQGVKISTRTVNGVKNVEAEENGTTYKIEHDPNKGIKVEITKKDAKGMAETKKYEAKTPEDLKMNHPEAYMAFLRFANPANAGRLNIAIGAVPGGVIRPAQAQLPLGVDPGDLDKVNKQLEDLIKRLGDATEKANIEDVKKITEELGKVRESLKKIRADADNGIEGRMRRSLEAQGAQLVPQAVPQAVPQKVAPR